MNENENSRTPETEQTKFIWTNLLIIHKYLWGRYWWITIVSRWPHMSVFYRALFKHFRVLKPFLSSMWLSWSVTRKWLRTQNQHILCRFFFSFLYFFITLYWYTIFSLFLNFYDQQQLHLLLLIIDWREYRGPVKKNAHSLSMNPNINQNLGCLSAYCYKYSDEKAEYLQVEKICLMIPYMNLLLT